VLERVAEPHHVHVLHLEDTATNVRDFRLGSTCT
jgi:hypothetical protein